MLFSNMLGQQSFLIKIYTLRASLYSFLQLVQDTLEHTSLLEVMGCTIIVCLLGHDILTVRLDNYIMMRSSHDFTFM